MTGAGPPTFSSLKGDLGIGQAYNVIQERSRRVIETRLLNWEPQEQFGSKERILAFLLNAQEEESR
jgi:hypothetical protein